MFKFIRFLFFFIIAAIIVLEIVCSLLLIDSKTPGNIGIERGFLNIKSLVYDRAKKNIGSDTLHVGDSVARQLFPPFQRDNNLTSVANVLASGNYIAIKNAIKNNPNIKVVFYGAIPTSLSLDFYEKKTSLNFVKPFLSIYKPSNLDKSLLRHMMTKPSSLLYLSSLGKFIPMDDVDFGEETIKGRSISRYSLRYLSKIQELCNEKGIKFVMYCPPLSQERKGATNDFSKLRTNKYPPILKKTLKNYSNSIKYRKRSDYKDGTHLKKPFLKETRNQYGSIVARLAQLS